VGFKPTISARELPQTYALDCAAIGTGDDNPIQGIKYDIICREIFMLAILVA
jgi:hypothetical protein